MNKIGLIIIILAGIICVHVSAAGAWHNVTCGGLCESACVPWEQDFWLLGSLTPDGCDKGLFPSLEQTGCFAYFGYPERCGCKLKILGECVIPKMCWHYTDECLIPEFRVVCLNARRMQSHASMVEQSWAYWALMDQRRIARHEPINWVMHVTTHNAFNNLADSYLVPNQRYSITDQLRMGARGLMLDIHAICGIVGQNEWLDSFVADNVRLSHAGADHWGATRLDRLFVLAIKEIRDWLRDNPEEVIILEIEDYLDDMNFAKEDYLGALSEYLGPWILRKEEKPVDRWLTINEMMAIGRRVIILSQDFNDDPLLFDNGWGGDYKFGFGSSKVKKFDPFTCSGNTTSFLNPGQKFSEVYEDRSAVGLCEPTGWICRSEGSLSHINAPSDCYDIKGLVDCNVSIIGLDRLGDTSTFFLALIDDIDLGSYEDEIKLLLNNRYDKLIWSWEENEYAGLGEAALLQADTGRWHSVSTDSVSCFACGRLREGDPALWTDYGPQTEWRITSESGKWADGGVACAEQYGSQGFVYSVPVNGLQQVSLRAAMEKADANSVWLAYRDVGNGVWEIDRAMGDNQITAVPRFVGEGDVVRFTASYEVPLDPQTADACIAALFADRDAWAFSNGSESVVSDLSFSQQDLETLFADGTAVFPVEHLFRNEGLYVVTHSLPPVCQAETRTLLQSVFNRSPELLEIPDQVVSAGESLVMEATYQDPGSNDVHTGSIIWGDDSTPEELLVQPDDVPFGAGVSGILLGDHVYTTCGGHHAEVTLTDGEGGFVSTGFNVQVRELPPAIVCPEDVVAEQQSYIGAVVNLLEPVTSSGVCSGINVSNNAPEIFPPGLTEVAWTARSLEPIYNPETDKALYMEDQCLQFVLVKDTIPPEITEARCVPDRLWPPNHRMVSVEVIATTSDLVDPDCQCTIKEILSNESEDGVGGMRHKPDWEITGDLAVNLRAERSGGGSGRVYTITIECTDESENSSFTTVEVAVPHDKGKKNK